MSGTRLGTILLWGCFAAFATPDTTGYTSLSGTLEGEYPRGLYLLSGEVRVPPRASATFEGGTLLTFEHGAALVVEGTLVCRGNPRATITFTARQSAAGGWPGIVVADGGEADLRYCTISAARTGLSVAREANVVLDQVSFRGNTEADLVYRATPVPIEEGAFLSLTFSPGEGMIGAPSRAPALRDEQSTHRARTSGSVNIPRVVFASLAGAGVLAGGGGWVYGVLNYRRYQEQSTAADPRSVAQYRDKAHTGRRIGIVGSALAGVALGGVVFTFVF